MLDIREFLLFGLAALLLALLTAAPARAEPARHLPGPVAAIVERVVDGDTLEVRAQIWLGQELRVLVRVHGIDTPELRGKCVHERQQAEKARAFVQEFIAGGGITLRQVNQDKYGGRVVAQVLDTHSRDLSAALIKAGLARPYDGGKRSAWCGPGMAALQSFLTIPP